MITDTKGLEMREQFEKFCRDRGWPIHTRDMPGSIRYGQYGSAYVQDCWLSWQAALAATGKQQVGEVQGRPEIAAVMDRCIRELRSFIDVAHDYDLDEMAVQALETAIESMELRKHPAQVVPEADTVTLWQMARLLGVKPSVVSKELMRHGIMATLNQNIDMIEAVVTAEAIRKSFVAQAAPEDVRRDAERFRWLLENCLDKWTERQSGALDCSFNFNPKGHDMGSAIDAAMLAAPPAQAALTFSEPSEGQMRAEEARRTASPEANADAEDFTREVRAALAAHRPAAHKPTDLHGPHGSVLFAPDGYAIKNNCAPPSWMFPEESVPDITDEVMKPDGECPTCHQPLHVPVDAREVFAEWHRRKGCSQQIINDCLSGSITMPDLAKDLVEIALATHPQPPTNVVSELTFKDMEVAMEQAKREAYEDVCEMIGAGCNIQELIDWLCEKLPAKENDAQPQEPSGWEIYNDADQYVTYAKTAILRNALLDCAGSTLPKWSARPVYTAPPAPAAVPVDDPIMDGTDGASAAWWRGNDRGVIAACERMEAALSGEDDGSGVMGCARLESLRRRLLATHPQPAAAKEQTNG